MKTMSSDEPHVPMPGMRYLSVDVYLGGLAGLELEKEVLVEG